ncbi:sodium:proton antiporter [Intrasporangium oryzae NRRL B-24470]|uniref:Sodium:proton antiporter n=1 Tax=Intrasporangium oryzae NRRL B-24470 TaxID=1386089 RepID=W9G636_9MICO|nr:cation:proton antiporter [Intrasporangium oryzae]EWT01621.1 sodium:proton antiporter [Intrasporangium oryzae NRRL B-24470]
MGPNTFLVVAALVFAWGMVSARLERADLTAPIVFLGAGAILGRTLVSDPASTATSLRPVVELTLVLVLFADAARVRPQDLRVELANIARLLGIGLPLTILAGWGLAAWLLPGLGPWPALLVAAALAPTDAALGIPVVTNPRVPARVRRLITVESGLNDGIATPVVLVAIAGAASAEGLADAGGLGEALLEIVVGALVGSAVGVAGGWILRRARQAGWVAEDFAGIAVLSLSVAAYTAAVTLGGNGFIAAFIGGLAFGAVAGRRGLAELVLVEQVSGLASLLVWLVFGAIGVSAALSHTSLATLCYAVLSLTAVRMVPVALACVGSGLGRDTVLFVGWFGPRGLASLVFALIAFEELGPDAQQPLAVILLTVVLSVIVHGLSAAPLADRFGRASARAGDRRAPAAPGAAEPGDLPVRGLPRRAPRRTRPSAAPPGAKRTG